MKNNNDFFLFDMSQMERVQLFDGMVFGRDESCDMVLEDEMVSGSHFKILIIDYEVYVVDLESSNNTFINDVAIIPGKQFRLNSKDVLRVGSLEYAYSSGAIRKLDLPSLSSTLKVDRLKLVDDSIPGIERIESGALEDLNDSLPGIDIIQPIKQESGLKALRSAKKYLDELNEISGQIHEKIEALKQMRRRKIDVGAKIDKTKKILEKSKFKNEKDFENELRLNRGTVEGFKMKIKKEEKEIAKARAIIEKAEAQIAQAKFNISGFEVQTKQFISSHDAVDREYDIFKNKSVFENEFETLKDRIKTYEALDLENKKNEVVKEIELRSKQYKDMQGHYGAKLNSEMIKKKASSE